MSIPENVRVSNSLLVNSKEVVIGVKVQFPPDHNAEQICLLSKHIQEEIQWFFTVGENCDVKNRK
jgi:hypothetical protein